ncbi:type VI secretion system ATPase TssH [Chitinimonas arctica]|uniref:Type VI secretion system ATPase TssH n=1 Tax=Chitinimonas arctica TaxID=2594795 RepID=A0A516SH68_9NEIS|nr:type VI secretion system ATPase TssH [Chitinimonas arctica]QDQ27499.1 type VI secretion system ATPase TssH [Chitinimonas arctica]
MSEISRAALFGKLDPILYKALEGATVLAKLRGHPEVGLAHWFTQILLAQDTDLHHIARHFNLDAARLAADLTANLERLPTHADAVDLSPDLELSTERAWIYATLKYGEGRVRGGCLLLALLRTPTLKSKLFAMSGEFRKIADDRLADELPRIVASSPEQAQRTADGMTGAAPGEASGALAPAALGKQDALKRYAVDLTERARSGALDPVSGRDTEIRQMIDILMRRRQNNPLLTGEAGVGKTAVVEGLALRIAQGDVPPLLQNVSILTLDIGMMQAGASMKGEFENRLKQVIEEVRGSERPIVLFIDEAHTLIGAGGAAGTGDAANLLKPALARGELRTIAATTWSEYKRHIEKDPALTRRFQVVQIHEPDEDAALIMMRGIVSQLERHHHVQVLDEAVEASVRLSHRYIPARQLPDKSVSLLDTACARVAVSQHATPAALENCTREIAALDIEKGILDGEAAIGLDRQVRLGEIAERLLALHAQQEELNQRWQTEREMAERVLALRSSLREQALNPDAEGEGEAPTDESRQEQLAELKAAQAELAQLQGESPLVLPSVDEQAVAAVVADWTGIPVGRMVRNEIKAVLQLATTLEQRVVGQNHALQAIARRIQVSRARLDDPAKPIGVFMLVGPSGVGKTETALALAETLYGGEQNLISINMSEFQESHTVSTLKGAPPGYVGYGEGGVLTEAVRRRPYSVVLLDEIEKAHPDVHEMFFQVFDKGWMEDGEGRYIDFRNTVILLTSNVGSELSMKLCQDPDLMPEPEGLAQSLRAELLAAFPAALLGRMTVVPYYPLSDKVMSNLIRMRLKRIADRLSANHAVQLSYDDTVVQLVADRCSEVESGGRMIDAILGRTVLPRCSQEILQRMGEETPLSQAVLSVEHGELAYQFS